MLEAVCRRRTRDVQRFDSPEPPTGLDHTQREKSPKQSPWKPVQFKYSGLTEFLDLSNDVGMGRSFAWGSCSPFSYQSESFTGTSMLHFY